MNEDYVVNLRHRGPHKKISSSSSSSSSSLNLFAEDTLGFERQDREEKMYSKIVVLVGLCVIVLLVFAKHAAVKWAGQLHPEAARPPNSAISLTTWPKFQLIQLPNSTWAYYLRARPNCTRPIDQAEATTWIETGEACRNGSCTNVTDLLLTLESIAQQQKTEAYSTQGKVGPGAPLPCAWARTVENTVLSYLNPKLVSATGLTYAVEVQLEQFDNHILSLNVSRLLTVTYRNISTGEQKTEQTEGLDAVAWTVALLILGN